MECCGNYCSLQAIITLDLNLNFLILIPLLNVEFFTGSVVAIREMPNSQVTPEFEDLSPAWFVKTFCIFFSPGIIRSPISVALQHNSGHIARRNCRVEICWSSPALLCWDSVLKAFTSVILMWNLIFIFYLIKAETLVICVASLVVAQWCLHTIH